MSVYVFFFSSRRRHTRYWRNWSSDVCSSDLAYAQNVDSPVDKFLTNPVHGHVTLGANEHLIFPHQRLVDGFNERGGLAGARRSVDDSHVLAPQDLVDSPFLRGVQPRERHGLKAELLRFLPRIEEVSQVGQPIVLGPNGPIEGVKHGLVARFVKGKLHADGLFGRLKVEDGRRVGHGDNHTVAVYVGNSARKMVII